MRGAPFFYKETYGIRITVRPVYLREQSHPTRGYFLFAYFVRIENVGAMAARLVWRRWLIHDDVNDGEDSIVEGDGVVGQQPLILSGNVHEYQSSCQLRSPRGYMEGHYRFVRPDGSSFDAQIPRFTLHADDVSGLYS